MKEKKKSSVVPQEYVDKMQEYNIDDWRKQKIADALKYQAERETGADVPSWWEGGTEYYSDRYNSKKYGTWWNCIATATDCFDNREGMYATGNKSFISPSSNTYYEKLGFRRLDDAEESQLGDIYQLAYPGGSPFHAMMLTGKDNDGEELYTWGTGVQNGIRRGRYSHDDKDVTRYRFIGKPSDIAEIEAHNARVKEYNEKTAPLREKREVAQLGTKLLRKTLMEEGLDKHLKLKNTYE